MNNLLNQKIRNQQHMKTQNILWLTAVIFTISACGQEATEGLAAKRDRLHEAKLEVKALQTEIATLEREIKAEGASLNGSANTTLVTTVPVVRQAFSHQIEVRGNVLSRTNVNVSSEMMGQLQKIYVREGQSVKQGTLLAKLDDETIKSNLAEVKTQLQFAQTIFEKRESLWKQNIGTEVAYLQAKNNKEALEMQQSTLETQLAKTVIRAPFSGKIEDVPAVEGQMMQPGLPVVFMVSERDMYISAEVSERYVGSLSVGDEVEVSLPAMKETFSSKIITVGSVINQASRTFKIELQIPPLNVDMKTNLVALVKLTDYHNENALVIPSRLIQEDEKGAFVYVANQQQAAKAYIQTGLSFSGTTEVLTGLNTNIQLIDKGARSVSEGTALNIEQ